MTIIYTLEHPITHEIRYVGKTVKTLRIRLWSHKSEKSNTYKCNWVQSLIKQNLMPVIKIVETVEDSIGSATEIYWIEQFKHWGFRLTNATEGGEGSLGLIRSQAWKDNIGKGNKGKIISEETRQKLRDCNLGKTHSEETKQKIRERVKLAHDNGIQGQIKPVYQYLNNIEIGYFKSAELAAQFIGTTRANIRQVCLGNSKTAAGFQWSYNQLNNN